MINWTDPKFMVTLVITYKRLGRGWLWPDYGIGRTNSEKDWTRKFGKFRSRDYFKEATEKASLKSQVVVAKGRGCRVITACSAISDWLYAEHRHERSGWVDSRIPEHGRFEVMFGATSDSGCDDSAKAHPKYRHFGLIHFIVLGKKIESSQSVRNLRMDRHILEQPLAFTTAAKIDTQTRNATTCQYRCGSPK